MNTEELGRSLVAAYARVPDPRGRRGRRHRVEAVLALSTAARLSGARSLLAISEWGRVPSPEVVRAVGFTRERTPAIGTRHPRLRRLDPDAVDAAVSAGRVAHLGADDAVIAVDGTVVRGTDAEGIPGLMVRAAATHEAGRVLVQAGGPDR